MKLFTPCLALLLLLALPACSKTGSNKEAAQRDFDRLCNAQKDFLEARKLKGVDIAELAAEKAKRMGEGLESEAALRAIEAMSVAAAGDHRGLVEKAAREAGLENWSCPELAEGH